MASVCANSLRLLSQQQQQTQKQRYCSRLTTNSSLFSSINSKQRKTRKSHCNFIQPRINLKHRSVYGVKSLKTCCSSSPSDKESNDVAQKASSSLSKSENGFTPGLVMATAVAILGAAVLSHSAQALIQPDVDVIDAEGNPLAGFAGAFLLIFFSEIGDKTFFIALLLALQQPKSAVFTGTFGALAIMSFISVALGEVAHEIDIFVQDFLPPALVNQPLDDYLAIALLVFFGVNTILDAAVPKADEEKEEAEEEVTKLTGNINADGTAVLAPLIFSTFVLVFAAEWGDKSFIATIALAAASSPAGVVTGAIAGHGVATGIAVLGGSFLGEYVSEQTVAYVGGSLFLTFAGATLLDVLSR